MGCDIHMYVEYKKTVMDKKTWICGDYFKINPYFNDASCESEYSRLELHGNRNYSIFSTIAGVRDYSKEVVPVSIPKGIPEDACEFVLSENESWVPDGHSHSWLTLKEIRDYQNTCPIMHYTGMISQEQITDLNNGKTPSSWCQGTNMPGYEKREWSEPNEVLYPLIEKMQKRAHELMQYEWEDYNTANDENIRIVFWFDN